MIWYASYILYTYQQDNVYQQRSCCCSHMEWHNVFEIFITTVYCIEILQFETFFERIQMLMYVRHAMHRVECYLSSHICVARSQSAKRCDNVSTVILHKLRSDFSFFCLFVFRLRALKSKCVFPLNELYVSSDTVNHVTALVFTRAATAVLFITCTHTVTYTLTLTLCLLLCLSLSHTHISAARRSSDYHCRFRIVSNRENSMCICLCLWALHRTLRWIQRTVRTTSIKHDTQSSSQLYVVQVHAY